MPDPRSNESFHASTPSSNATEAPSRALPAFFGTLGALVVFSLLIGGAYLIYSWIKSPATAPSPAPVASAPAQPTSGPVPPATPKPAPVASTAKPSIDDPSTWVLSAQPAQTLTSDSSPDIGWWARTFDLPNEAKVTDYLKNQGMTVASIVPLHYADTKDATTITYQVQGEVPAQLLHVPKATWTPSDPELKPFASVIVFSRDLPAGQFWNTAQQSTAEPAGAKLDFAWQVQLDKATGAVTADSLPLDKDVFTVQEVAQMETETNDTLNQLRAQVNAIDARVQADTQAKLAQVPADPPKPELMSTHWNHGDGSGEPTKSAERIGGGTVAGAAGGAAFGDIAGDAGEGAGIGAGVGLLGGLIYDTVSKNNDRHRYEDHARAVNAERMSDWRAQVRALNQQRDQIKKGGDAEKQQALQDLANRIQALGGHLDQLPPPADVPVPAPVNSDSGQIQIQPSSNQPSGPVH